MKSASVALLMPVIFAAIACGADDRCTCAADREAGGWCDACRVGYVASVRIESKPFFEAIDAHGHSVRRESIRCADCRNALDKDGFCEKCRVGFVGGEAYFSRMTYLIGRGRFTPSGTIECPACRKHLESPGWCGECDRGMVGHFAYQDKKLFSQAARAREVLRDAIGTIPDCLSCAIAKAVDRKCRRCEKSFEDGKRVESSGGAK